MLKDFEFNLNKWHLLLILIIGFLATFFSFVVTAIWVIAIVFCLIGVFKKNCFIYVWYTIAMSPGLEIWGRMAKAPAIPWEIGKYFLFVVIIAMLFGNWEKRPLYKVGVYLIIAILPSLVIALINLPFNFENWLMHAAGILQIGILLLYTSRERISKINFIKILKISIIPIIPIVEYITIKTPKFNDVDFKLVANKLNKKAFELNIVKKDGSVEDISWRLCITGKPKTDKHELMSALRYSIEDQIKEYRDSVCIDKCMLCNEYINNDINIDHIIHFEKLVNDFHSSIMLKIPIKFDDANDNSNRRKFKKEDSDYENAWKEYHKNNSKLRVLCQSCNLRREKYKA